MIYRKLQTVKKGRRKAAFLLKIKEESGKIEVVIGMIERQADMRSNVKMVDMESLVPKNHLLRKIERVIDFERIYAMVEHLYCEDNGRPAVDPVVLVKIILIQHLYGIRSLRQTVREMEMNIAYRWFLHYDIDTSIPHFATVSYAFATRFPSGVLVTQRKNMACSILCSEGLTALETGSSLNSLL